MQLADATSPTSSKLMCRTRLPNNASPWSSAMVPCVAACWPRKLKPAKNSWPPRNSVSLYFQGYFFRKPETMKTHAVQGNRLNYIKMLQVVSKPELEPREIENAIKGEASLVLPPVALHEFRELRVQQRHQVGTARALDSGRTRSPALGAPGGHAGRGTEPAERTRALRHGSCPLLRIALAQN